MHYIYDCTFGDVAAKITVHTPLMYRFGRPYEYSMQRSHRHKLHSGIDAHTISPSFLFETVVALIISFLLLGTENIGAQVQCVQVCVVNVNVCMCARACMYSSLCMWCMLWCNEWLGRTQSEKES